MKPLSDSIACRLVEFPDRKAWQDGMRERIGGSRVAGLFGVSDWVSTYQLWAIYTGQVTDELDDSTRLRLGRLIEKPLLEELAVQTGWRVEPWPQTTVAMHADESLRFGVTPDALAEDLDGAFAVQVKSVNEFAYKRWPRDEDGALSIPAPYLVQTQAELECLGLDRGVLAVLFGKDRLEWIPYQRHAAFCEKLRERIRWFWGLVDSRTPPDADGSEATARVLAELYPDDDGSAVELAGDADVWAARLAEAKAAIKEAEAVKEEMQNLLRAAMGEATFATTPDGANFSLKSQTRETVDAAKLRDKFPEAFAACRRESSFRVLRSISKLPAEALAQL